MNKVIICIGTSKCIGDSLGPLVGENLYNRINKSNIYVFGNLKNNITYQNIDAVLSKITPLIASFDFVKFKSNIWYYYIPNKSSAFYILYLIFGLIIPILINKIIIKSKKLLLDKFNIKNKFLKNNRKTSQA